MLLKRKENKIILNSMSNKEELREIEEDFKVRESEKLQKFGFDISKIKEFSKETIRKNQKIRKIGKIIVEIILIALALRLIGYVLWYIISLYEIIGNMHITL